MNGPSFCHFTSVAVTYGEQPDRHYDLVDETYLINAMQNPFVGDKAYAPCFMPSAYHAHDAREHDAQRQRGQFWALAFDVDTGNRNLADLQAVLGYALPPCRVHIHATANSGRLDPPKYDGGKRWRVLVMLAQPLPGEWYGPVMEAAAVYLSEQSDALSTPVEFDPCTRREGQFMYGPTKGSFHYEVSIGQGSGLDLGQVKPITVLAAHIHAQRAAYESNRSASVGSAKGGFVGVFNRQHSIEELLVKYGYTARGRRDEWRSPFNSSGSFGTRVFNLGSDDEYFVSKSESDTQQGIGRQAPRGGVMGDAFDLFKFYEHGNDEAKAVAAIKGALYGCATSGCEYREARTDPMTGEFLEAGLQPLPNREPGNGWDIWQGIVAEQEAQSQRRVDADKAAAEESRQFAEAAAKAEKQRWGGDWLKQVPFDIEPNALEWAAWHAPGIIGEAVRAKSRQATRRSLVPLLAGALAAVCHLGQGKVVLRFKHFVTPSTLMMFLVGGTGSGKGDAANMFYDIVQSVRPEASNMVMSKVMRNFASGEAVTQFLADVCPNVVLLQNEAGASRAANRGNGRQESVAAELTDIFTAFANGIEGTHAKTAGLSVKAVANPSIAALLLSTPDKLFKTIEGGDAESGWLGRYLFLPLRQSEKVADTSSFVEYPASFIAYVNRLAQLLPPQTALDPRVYNGPNQSFHALHYSSDAEEYMKEIDRVYDKKVIDPRYSKLEQALYSRAQEAVSRLSFVAGLSMSVDQAVSLQACEWAAVVVKASLEYVTSRMEHSYDGDEDDSPSARVRQTVKDYFKRATVDEKFAKGFGLNLRRSADDEVELARSQLKKRMVENVLKRVKITGRQVNEELDEMIKDGMLLDVGKDLHGRNWLRWMY